MTSLTDTLSNLASAAQTRSRAWWIRTVSYWLFTALVALEMVAGSMWDLLQIEYVRGVFDRLGYPYYLLLILGVWKLPGAIVVVVPGLPRLKEWAYAGFVFNFTGAAASHLLAGDGPEKWIGPLVFAAFALLSWGLRPPERRLPEARPAPDTRPVAWVVSIAVLVAMLVVALATLPVGPPPA